LGKIAVILFMGLFLCPSLNAQTTDRYLTSAVIYLSVDDWGDIWLNGHHIVDQQPYTDYRSTGKIIRALPKSLCYFQNDNILAIEVSKAVVKKPAEDEVAIAYVLKLGFSDGTEETLSSNELSAHRSYYISNRMAGDPRDWQKAGFNDNYWREAQTSGSYLPRVALLNDPDTHQGIQYLSANNAMGRAQRPGERHLFRRKFSLDIVPNPICLTPTIKKVEPPISFIMPEGPRHVYVPPTKTPTPLPTSTPWPTPTPWPTLPPPAAPRYYPTNTPIPHPTPVTPYVFPKLPTYGPTAVYRPNFWSLSTAPVYQPPTPTFTPLVIKPTRRWKPISTPTPWVFAPTYSPTVVVYPPVQSQPVVNEPPEPLMHVMTPLLIETPNENPANLPQTILFDSFPANIYVVFAEGTGVYQVEMFDMKGNHLKTPYQKMVVAQKDAWVDWDGTDDSGAQKGSGPFSAVFSKDGIALKKIILYQKPIVP